MNNPSRFLVPNLARQAEQAWSALLAKRFNCLVDDFKASPEEYMVYLPETVRVELMDGSNAEFRRAFAIVSEEMKAVAVFTEHCGHHIFPYHEAMVYRNGLLQYQQGVMDCDITLAKSL